MFLLILWQRSFGLCRWVFLFYTSNSVSFCTLSFLPTLLFLALFSFSCLYTEVFSDACVSARNFGKIKELLKTGTMCEKLQSAKKIKNIKKERKVAKTLSIVLLTFLVSFVPACVIIYLLNFCLSCNCLLVHWLRDIQKLTISLNSAVNPYLYAWRLPQFKKAFLKLLHLQRAQAQVNPALVSSVGQPDNTNQMQLSLVCNQDLS